MEPGEVSWRPFPHWQPPEHDEVGPLKSVHRRALTTASWLQYVWFVVYIGLVVYVIYSIRRTGFFDLWNLFLLIFLIPGPGAGLATFYRSRNFVAVHQLGVAVQWSRRFFTHYYWDTLRGIDWEEDGSRRGWLYVGGEAFEIEQRLFWLEGLRDALEGLDRRIMDRKPPEHSESTGADLRHATHWTRGLRLVLGLTIPGIVLFAIFGFLLSLFPQFDQIFRLLLQIYFVLLTILVVVGLVLALLGVRRISEFLDGARTWIIHRHVGEILHRLPWVHAIDDDPFEAILEGQKLEVLVVQISSRRSLVAMNNPRLEPAFEKLAIRWEENEAV